MTTQQEGISLGIRLNQRNGISCLVAFLLITRQCSLAAGAEVGRLGTGGLHGILLYRVTDSQFALLVRSLWGGSQDQTSRQDLPESLSEVVERVPVGGYDRDTWWLASPHGDNWSARFTTSLKVATEGEYTFYYKSDDGARMWIDDRQIINDWVPRSGLTSEVKVKLTTGDHAVRCEFFEQGGGAQAHLEWAGPDLKRQVVPASVTSAEGKPGWKAEYFLNVDLTGDATLNHHEKVDFDWGEGGPESSDSGPLVVILDWARISDGVVIGQLRAPAKAKAGVVLRGIGPVPPTIHIRGNEMGAIPGSAATMPELPFRLRVLGEGAAYAVGNTADTSGVWQAGATPLLFAAGFGKLPELDLKTATAQLQKCMSTGLNAPFPELGEGGWASLFNGKDLTGWKLRNPNGVQSWKVEDGVLSNAGHGTDLFSEVRLTDFELHVEFMVPPGSNSGVYLQGRYEVQVLDSFGQGFSPGMCCAIYSKTMPTKNVCKPANEWQTYDITFRGARPSLDGGKTSNARATVVFNGEKVIDNIEIDGVTGGAMDNDECRAHGIMLQGDHGVVHFRNIRVRPCRIPGR
ncbi:MAG: DUF1080 domain-containing protein [Armatimonadetes bacterium]|nr:DUF1080 domain-containing protein [Armatimonadota bacterium]